MSKLLRAIFENDKYNRESLDGVPCSLCGEVPKIDFRKDPDHVETIRSSRVDCNNGHFDVTYCLPCWRKLVFTSFTTYEKIKQKHF